MTAKRDLFTPKGRATDLEGSSRHHSVQAKLVHQSAPPMRTLRAHHKAILRSKRVASLEGGLIALWHLLGVSELEGLTTSSDWTPQVLSKTGHRVTKRDVGWPIPSTN